MKYETTADEIIKAAKTCLENYLERESDNIERAKKAIRFRALEQWPEAIKNERENPHQDGGPRPCPVLDKTNQYVRQVINEERQNRAAIKIRPVDSDADPKVAEVITGIIRHIEDQSEAIEAYTKAGEHAIDGGFGYFRIITEYTDPMSFDQDIRIKRIHNRFSVALGPHTETDGSDAREAVVWEDMSLEDFKAEYPNAETAGFEPSDSWGGEDTIRVAEYMCIKSESMTIHMMDDGTVLTDEQLQIAKREFPEIEPEASRETTKEQVKWYKITGQEILEQTDMLGRFIPVIKVVGNETTMPDGKIRLSGMIEAMMDPQMLHNYAHAGFIEHVALAPRAPWIAEETQVEGYEADYENANRRPITLLKYKGTSDETGQPLPPPQRTSPAGIAPGWQQMLMNTEHGVEGAAGLYGPTVGAKSQEKSGIALQEQKQQGMVGNFHYPDNLARSIQHCGRILLEWIPGIYDTNRVARILGEDGEQELIYLDPNQPSPVMEMDKKTYNLNIGKYDVTVATGPSYTSKRQEAAENQIQLLQAKPELMQVIGDIVFSNMDMPGADKIAERLKIMLPPQIQQMENKEKPMDPQAQAMMAQIKAANEELDQKARMLNEAKAKLDELSREVENDKTTSDIQKAQLDSLRKDVESKERVFRANVAAETAKLQLVGQKIIDQLEDVTEPLQKASEPVNDPQMVEMLQNISEISLASQQQMGQFIAQALENLNGSLMEMSGSFNGMSEIMARPRNTRIVTDENGEPIGTVTE